MVGNDNPLTSDMDKEIQKGLSDRLYDKRKAAALELEQSIRACLVANDRDRIKQIIDQLCRDFAYAVHHPNARNGGLIGLAAAAISLGQNEVAAYLDDIVHPVLACFGDQDPRVRYYACESMYNIAKVAKGEILIYFNEIFDALCKLAADSEASVKNGADLLDRLVKDIVAEKAVTYVSVIQRSPPTMPTLEEEEDQSKPTISQEEPQNQTTFSLPKFIPLLMERIYAINPFTRMFLVSWITLLDSIPDLELVSYLPSFLGGLISFLSDPNKDVRVATHACLDGFLQEIRRITEIKKAAEKKQKEREASDSQKNDTKPLEDSPDKKEQEVTDEATLAVPSEQASELAPSEIAADSKVAPLEGSPIPSDLDSDQEDGIYYPGQDVHIDFNKVIDILLSHLDSSEEDIQLTVLGWFENILDVSPSSMLPHTPRVLSVLLPTMATEAKELRYAAERVNSKMLDLIMSLSTGEDSLKLDYAATVNSLTLHFLNEKEETRVAALDWLIMLHRRVPRKILAINDGTFPALLKTLSDPSEEVITKDLQLLAQLSYNSDDEYFTVFMVNLLNLFSTDRRLLETRGNLIIRQLCISLNPERIYRTLAEILERDDDIEFSSIMVQNLSNNLLTAPELSDLRMRLRNLNGREGANFFVSLFKCWCHNSAATLSLCLLAQAYEHAFQLLQIVVEFDITVSMLIQLDRLVQLLESPVFTHLRLQLLEPEHYPYLYKVLYGILMILPQSSAFETLKNRLNSVSPIGYIHLPARSASLGGTNSSASSTVSGASTKQSGGRYLQSRDDVKWSDLLDKFRSVQRRHQEARAHPFTKSMSDLTQFEEKRPAAESRVDSKSSRPSTPTAKLPTAKEGSRRFRGPFSRKEDKKK